MIQCLPVYFFKLKNVCQFNYPFGWACLLEARTTNQKIIIFLQPGLDYFKLFLACYLQPAKCTFVPFEILQLHTGDIVRGHFKVFQIRWRKKLINYLRDLKSYYAHPVLTLFIFHVFVLVNSLVNRHLRGGRNYHTGEQFTILCTSLTAPSPSQCHIVHVDTAVYLQK